MNKILIIYDLYFEEWYRKSFITSTQYEIKNIFLENIDYDLILKEIEQFENIVLILQNGHMSTKFSLDIMMEKLNENNIKPKNIVKVCFSNELNLYTFHNLSDKHQKHVRTAEIDLDLQLKYKNDYNIRQLSCLINNEVTIFDPSIWPTSFTHLVGNIENLFDNENRDFLKSKNRFGININRKTFERLALVKMILNEELVNPELITITNSKSYIGQTPCFFNQKQLDILLKNEKDYINIYAYTMNDYNGVPTYETTHTIKFWQDGYRIFCESKIDIVMETFNHLPDMQDWQMMFTEKTLKPVWAAKPMLVSDPMTFKLFEKWGFEIDEKLYGEQLLNEFRSFEKDDEFKTVDSPTKGLTTFGNNNMNHKYKNNVQRWLTSFANRLIEIDRMEEKEFNELYENSLIISLNNRQKLKNWDKWYNNIEKWFLN